MSCTVKFFKNLYIPFYGTIYHAKKVDSFGNVQISRAGDYIGERYKNTLLRYLKDRGYKSKIINSRWLWDTKNNDTSLIVVIKTKEDKITFDIMNVGVIEIPHVEPPAPEPLPVLKI